MWKISTTIFHCHSNILILWILIKIKIGNEEAVRAYTMIDPIQQMLDDIEELMKYRNYQPAIDKITEVIEVEKLKL